MLEELDYRNRQYKCSKKLHWYNILGECQVTIVAGSGSILNILRQI